MALGDHLCTKQDVHLSFVHCLENPQVIIAFCAGIPVKALDPCLWEKTGKLFLQPLGADTYGNK
jgi:hypothetical protein